MKGVGSLSAYLKSEGVDSSTSLERIAALKKEYWKLYHQQYYQRRKKGQHRFTLRLTDDEYRRLTSYAKQHKRKSLAQFVREAALGYVEQQYIPRDPDVVDTLTKAIRKIGNVVNQVVQSIHRTAKRQHLTGAFSEERTLAKLQREYEFLVKQIHGLEHELASFMVSPPKRVGEALWEILRSEPEKINQIRSLLDDIEKKMNQDASH